MAHLKRLVAPESWGISKKEYKFITRPNAGPHKLDESIPLNVVVKNLLGHANTTRESKKIITAGKVLVDNKPRTDYRFPLGLMDIIDIPETKQAYTLILDTYGKFKLSPAKNKTLRYCKVLGKTTLKGKKTQLNLSAGKSLIVLKDEYKAGDTVILDLSTNKIKTHIKFEKNSLAYITAGKYMGNIGKIIDIHKLKLSKDKIALMIGSHKYETLKEYAFVIDKSFAENEGHKSDEKD